MCAERYRVEVPDIEYYQRNINCQYACPARTDARGYVNAIADGHYGYGYIMARQPNPFASICGRVCMAPCEAACRRGVIDKPIAIRALKRFVTEKFGVEAKLRQPRTQLPPLELAPGNSRTWDSALALAKLGQTSARRKARVAIVGSGPAGLTAAHDLAILSYKVTVFEALPEAGGMMRVGIPEYRLPREVLNAEISWILSLGVELKTNTRIDSVDELFHQGYEAVFLALGAHRGLKIGMKGEDGLVQEAVNFLRDVNMGQAARLSGKVGVVGGGNVAIDAARCALRLGAREVTILYRRTRAEMPASHEEVEQALREGVKLVFLTAPLRISQDGGHLKMVCQRMKLGAVDESGRARPEPIPGSEFPLDFDVVMAATGQAPEVPAKFGLPLGRGNTIKVDTQTLAAFHPGVYAGGDCVSGPASVIAAVGAGHTVARSIDQYLTGKQWQIAEKGWMQIVAPRQYLHKDYMELEQRPPQVEPFNSQEIMRELEWPYSQEEAKAQAERCLRCHIQTVFDGDKCVLCGGCIDVCPKNCYKMVRLDEIQGDERFKAVVAARYGISLDDFHRAGERGEPEILHRGTAIIKDETACIRCGLCARRCPVGAITMEAFYFEEELVLEPQAEQIAGRGGRG